MPLSEQEQRLLDEMERHLMHNDTDVVSAASASRPLSYRNLVYGGILLLLGVGVLVVGVALSAPTGVGIAIGVVGFVLMLGGVILAVTPSRNAKLRVPSEPSAATRASNAPQNGGSFMDRMNDRWDRRTDDR